MTELWIDSTAFSEMSAEAERMYPLETGGVLVGYVADTSEPVIQHVIGPGPAGSHKRYRFHPDHEWQCAQLDKLFDESHGRAVYLGDWHTHPDGSARMSWLDRRTLRNIARHKDVQLAHPLMLIGGGEPETWDWQAHRYVSDAFSGLDIRFDALRVRTFQAKK